MQDNKRIVIIYRGAGRDFAQDTPKVTSYYKRAYEQLYDFAAEQGLTFSRAPLSFYDPERKLFKKVWSYRAGSWFQETDVVPNLINDKVYDNQQHFKQKQVLAKSYKIVNPPELIDLIDHKLVSNRVFPEHTKKSYLVSSASDLEVARRALSTDLVVLKSLIGSGGKQVQILERGALSGHRLSYPLIAQEFIDSSRGCPDLVNGVHDFRLVVVNDQINYAYFRLPKAGLLKANLALGGTMQIIKNSQIPQSIQDVFAVVRQRLSVVPKKIYTVDFMFDQNLKPWIIELNSMPAYYFPDEVHSAVMYSFYQEMINLFKSEI